MLLGCNKGIFTLINTFVSVCLSVRLSSVLTLTCCLCIGKTVNWTFSQGQTALPLQLSRQAEDDGEPDEDECVQRLPEHVRLCRTHKVNPVHWGED